MEFDVSTTACQDIERKLNFENGLFCLEFCMIKNFRKNSYLANYRKKLFFLIGILRISKSIKRNAKRNVNVSLVGHIKK